MEDLIGVKRQTLLNYIKGGQLNAVKIGGKWKVSKATLEKLMLGEAATPENRKTERI